MFLTIIMSLFALNSHADICETKYTLMHYAQSKCVDVVRPVNPTSQETFKIRSVIIARDLSLEDQQQTVVILPGGPGQSGGDLRDSMQQREVINSMWGSMKVNVVLFDPRGTGLSLLPVPPEKFDRSVISMDLLVEDLKAVIENTAGNKPVVLLAHSAGGHVALKFAEKYPKLVSHLALISASMSIRQMGELTMGLQAWDSFHWKRFLKTVKDENVKKDWDAKYQFAEEVVKQQQKARVLKQYVNPKFPLLTLGKFRDTLIKNIEIDPTGKSFMNLVEQLIAAFKDYETQGGLPLAPQELKNIKLKESDFPPFIMHASDWIKRVLLCGEGLTQEETLAPIYLEGLNLNDHFCSGFYHTGEFSEPVLENIKTPVVFFSGQQDTQVPTYIAREIVARLPNAKLVVSKEAGHLFVDIEPAVFYDSLKELITKK